MFLSSNDKFYFFSDFSFEMQAIEADVVTPPETNEPG